MDLVEAGEVVGVFGDHADGSGILEIPEDLAGRGSLVDGNENGAREPGGKVDESPLVACLAHQPDLVAGLDASGHEPLCERGDLAEELRRRQILPAAVCGREREERAVRGGLDPVDQQVSGVGLGIGLNNGGNVELFHGNSFGTGWGHSP